MLLDFNKLSKMHDLKKNENFALTTINCTTEGMNV